ncbi:MAG: hypothetical protein WAT70_10765 [Rhizobiaceae bacterium]
MLNALEQFLREAPLFVFLFAFGIPALIAGGSLFAAFWAWRNARAIASTPAVRAAAAEPGYRLVEGRLDDKTSTRAPLTGRPCVWWTMKIEESVRSIDSDRRSDRRWNLVRESSSRKPLVLADGATRITVDPQGAIVYPSAWSEWYGANETPADRDPALNPGTDTPGGGGRIEVMSDPERRFRYQERYVFAAEPMFALGDVRAGPRGLAIGKPAGRKPFILSVRSPSDISAENGLAVQGGLIVAIVFAGIALAVLKLRYG